MNLGKVLRAWGTQLQEMGQTATGGTDPHAYALRPVEYAAEVLGITTLTEPQKQILRALHEPPYRVLVPAGHDVGKSFVAAVAASYWYDSFNPGLVLTTAPRESDILQIIWTELRLLRSRANLPQHDMAPKSAYLGDGPEHYCAGYVSQKGQAFQGRHRPRMLFIFDEANDVQPLHWITARTMADPTLGSAWLAIFNPTSTTSQAYQEDMRRNDETGAARWTRLRLSALDHPNVLASLAGQSKPIPGAVSLEMVNDAIQDWCEPVEDPVDVLATDVQWPPGSGKWYRPGPLFQCRMQGNWPDQGNGVWSPSLWQACFPEIIPQPHLGRLPELGVDCAMGKGEDYHAIHARWGAVSWHHETANTMDAVRIAGRVRDVAGLMARAVVETLPVTHAPIKPQAIRVKIDDDGTGNAVCAILKRDGYNVTMVSAATRSLHPDQYPRMRDEAWFQTAAKAKRGLVCFNRLDRRTRERLEQQLLAPVWDLNNAGQQVVEPKDETKERIGRSPDDADAANLAFLDIGVVASGEGVANSHKPLSAWGEVDPVRESGRERMYGRRE